MGPGTGTALYAAKIADIEPIVYFVHYQLPVAIPMILVIAILNILFRGILIVEMTMFMKNQYLHLIRY